MRLNVHIGRIRAGGRSGHTEIHWLHWEVFCVFIYQRHQRIPGFKRLRVKCMYTDWQAFIFSHAKYRTKWSNSIKRRAESKSMSMGLNFTFRFIVPWRSCIVFSVHSIEKGFSYLCVSVHILCRSSSFLLLCISSSLLVITVGLRYRHYIVSTSFIQQHRNTCMNIFVMQFGSFCATLFVVVSASARQAKYKRLAKLKVRWRCMIKLCNLNIIKLKIK